LENTNNIPLKYDKYFIIIHKFVIIKPMKKLSDGFTPSTILSGFTIIEILVVITVIGVLSTIGIVSFSNIQAGSRDSQRSSKITVIAEALEKYYSQNGEYPSCNAMSAAPSTVTTNTLVGMDPNDLTAPSGTSGTNSILASCADLPAGTDGFAYVGDSACIATSGKTCLQYTLKYLEQASGQIKIRASRHASVPLLMAPSSSPATTVTFSNPNVLATITPVSCNTGTAQYQINSRTNDGSWTGWTAWSTTTTASQAANQGVKYGYMAQAQCYIDDFHYSPTVTGAEGTYIRSITAPTMTTVTANTVGSTTTWSWPAVTCASGTTASYQYDYTVSPAGSDSGWVSNGSNLSVAFTTSTGGQTYTVAVQAKCTNAYAASAWSGLGSASYSPPQTGSQSYTTAGTYTFTVPANVIRVTAILIGAGGGGGATDGVNAGSGGGGGASDISIISVTPGAQLSVVVGSGGSVGNSPGGIGNASTFSGHSAAGGLGGCRGGTAPCNAAPYYTGGAGGVGSSYGGDGKYPVSYQYNATYSASANPGGVSAGGTSSGTGGKGAGIGYGNGGGGANSAAGGAGAVLIFW
jgi:prepilin-type N-terminal cleavage/methylation domain-containing protein